MQSSDSRDHPRWIRDSSVETLAYTRLRAAKVAFTARRFPYEQMFASGPGGTLLGGAIRPRSGDLVLATVARIGHHSKIELANGRRSRMHVGDEIVVAYGDRYAPDQFEAEVPADLGGTHLVASGGVAATVVSRHEATRRPTEILPVGLIGDSMGMPLNLADFSLDVPVPNQPRPHTIAVVGTSMNSGKTTTVESLVRGFRLAGGNPGATKVTGTGSGADYWVMVDAGAHCVADFTDVGLASTYRIPYPTVEANLVRLVDHLTNAGSSDIVMEIADGMYQQETAELIRSDIFRSSVDGIVFAAADATGAIAGARMIRDLDLPLLGVSGVFTRSPLGVREVAANGDSPVFTREQLASADVAGILSSPPKVVDLRSLDGLAPATSVFPIFGDSFEAS